MRFDLAFPACVDDGHPVRPATCSRSSVLVNARPAMTSKGVISHPFWLGARLMPRVLSMPYTLAARPQPWAVNRPAQLSQNCSVDDESVPVTGLDGRVRNYANKLGQVLAVGQRSGNGHPPIIQKVEATVDAAIDEGKITPGRRKHWVSLITADSRMADVLASIPDETAVPLSEIGHSAAESDTHSRPTACAMVLLMTSAPAATIPLRLPAAMRRTSSPTNGVTQTGYRFGFAPLPTSRFWS